MDSDLKSGGPRIEGTPEEGGRESKKSILASPSSHELDWVMWYFVPTN
jgi:hypothetical protein